MANISGFLRGELQQTYGYLAYEHEEHEHEPNPIQPTSASDCCAGGCDSLFPAHCPKPDPHQEPPKHASWFSGV
jgi:hypothetical protein